MAFLVILERLAPDERAAFLLHEVFGEGYPEIARILDKNETSCRQMVHRARERVQRERPRFSVSRDTHQRLLERFMAAIASADAEALMNLFAEDATWTADGGGRAPAAPQALQGRLRIVQLLMGLLRKQDARTRYSILPVNGMPGLVVTTGDQVAASISFATDGQQIVAAYAVVNPEKLHGIRVPTQVNRI